MTLLVVVIVLYFIKVVEFLIEDRGTSVSGGL